MFAFRFGCYDGDMFGAFYVAEWPPVCVCGGCVCVGGGGGRAVCSVYRECLS